MDELFELILYFLDAIVGDNKRFFAWFVPAIVAVAIILWLVPGWGLKITLSIPTMASGIICGVIWERRKPR